MAGLRAAKSNSRMTTMSKTTHIICILDRSGSMGHMTQEVIGNFNHFLAEQKELEGKAKLTLAIFDNHYDLIYDEVDLQKAKPLTNDVYYARGGTALRDAVGRTLTNKQRKKKAIVMIHTDGWENCSREYSPKDIKKLTNKLKKKWEFIFVGAGIDAAETNRDFGFTHTLNANNNSRSYGNQYDMFNATTTNYRSMGMKGAAVTAGIVAEANANEVNGEAGVDILTTLGNSIDLENALKGGVTTDTITTTTADPDDPFTIVKG